MEDLVNPAQRAQMEEQLKNLDAAIAEQKLHPIVKHALILLQTPDGRWHDPVPEENMKKLEALVERAKSEKSLVLATWDLLKLSVVLHKEMKVGRAALELFALVNRTIVQNDLVSVLRKDVDPAKVAAAQAFMGDEKVIPAKVGDKAPEGTLRVDQLPGRKPRL